MTEVTVEDVRERLGLLPWDEFALNQIKKKLQQSDGLSAKEVLDYVYGKQETGRTTFMLCEYLAWQMNNPDEQAVLVGKFDAQGKQLVEKAQAFASKLGIKLNTPIGKGYSYLYDIYYGPANRHFHDHLHHQDV